KINDQHLQASACGWTLASPDRTQRTLRQAAAPPLVLQDRQGTASPSTRAGTWPRPRRASASRSRRFGWRRASGGGDGEAAISDVLSGDSVASRGEVDTALELSKREKAIPAFFSCGGGMVQTE